jgi:hypothetical protein
MVDANHTIYVACLRDNRNMINPYWVKEMLTSEETEKKF